MGLWFFLFYKGQWNPATFTQMLTILLLLEGSLIGAAGAFMFFGYSEARIFSQAAINPIIARDQATRWRERRLSQQKLGITMLITGALLILLFLLVGFSIAL